MDFLKDVFGEEALTFTQLQEKLQNNKDIKLANLAGGGYVGKEKYSVLEQERDGYKNQLSDANKKLEGYDPDWAKKAADAQKAADDKISAVKMEYALDAALGAEKAKNPKLVKALLNREKLVLNEDGTVLGLTEQLKPIKTENEYLFESDQEPPNITITKPGSPSPTPTGHKEYLNTAYKGNPFYNKQ